MSIPEIAEELRQLAVQHDLPRLAELADEMRRRPSRNRAAPQSAKMTPELKTAICAYKDAHPGLSYSKVATVFNVNPGRVSEALADRRLKQEREAAGQ